MIEMTLATEFVPGTNLQGDMVSADWRFLLPNLQFETILCVEVPSISNSAVLSTIGKEVFVVSNDKLRLDKFENECEKAKVENIRFFHVADHSKLPFKDERFSLIHLSKREITKKFFEDKDLQSNLVTLLKDDGVINYQVRSFGERLKSQIVVRNLQEKGFDAQQSYWLTPFKGEMRTALPTKDGTIASFFFNNVIYGQSLKKRVFSRIGNSLSRLGLIGSVMPRRIIFLQKGVQVENSNAPPKFLLSLAEKVGINLENHKFGLSTRGKYNANKVIYYLFQKSSNLPDAIVKMTRAPQFNSRLENEYRSLSLLNENEFVEKGSFPEPLFFDHYHDLAILAQKAVHGVPFRTKTGATPNCSIAQEAINWLVQLGRSSANNSLVKRSEVAGNMNKLFRRFTEIYELKHEEKTFMSEQISRIANNDASFPLVFQHGDPGTWNILASENGKVIFIDWEAGEPHGIPLWDLFYFMRTYASWVSRTQGSRDALTNFSNNFLTPSVFSEWLTQITQTYCVSIDLETELVEPLFFTCWMHRALKESTRLTRTSLEKGHYYNLLKLCIQKRNVSTLDSLFSLNSNNRKTKSREVESTIVR